MSCSSFEFLETSILYNLDLCVGFNFPGVYAVHSEFSLNFTGSLLGSWTMLDSGYGRIFLNRDLEQDGASAKRLISIVGRVGISSHCPDSSHFEVTRIISAPFSTSCGIHTHLRCPGILLNRKRWSRNTAVFGARNFSCFKWYVFDRYVHIILAVTPLLPLVCLLFTFWMPERPKFHYLARLNCTELSRKQLSTASISSLSRASVTKQGRAQHIIVATRTRISLQ